MRSASARAPSGSMHEIVVPELKRGTPRFAGSPSPYDWTYTRSASSWRLSASSRFVVERLMFTTSNAFSIAQRVHLRSATEGFSPCVPSRTSESHCTEMHKLGRFLASA
jgi:hypothetical protein